MPENVSVLQNKVTIYRRENSGNWQARIKLKSGEWDRRSTKTDDLDEATEIALKYYYGAETREQNNLPQSTRKFRRVAKFALERMQNELDNGGGKTVFKDYIRTINKYLIPYFGKYDIANIGIKELNAYANWRDECIAGERWEKQKNAAKNRATNPEQAKAALALPKPEFAASQSTINTHNSALNRVFDEALLRGWITTSIKPTLVNKGIKSESRGAFTLDEYRLVYRNLRSWSTTGHRSTTRDLREVLREYVLFLANTGIRHGTEALNLRWRNIHWITNIDGEKYLAVNVRGKTGAREAIARDNTSDYLDRLRDINPNLSYESLDALLKAKVDEPVFVTRSGKAVTTDALRGSFRQFLKKYDLLIGADGKPRSLYSLRHTYATFALESGRDIYVLAVQMGTSVSMLENFYSKVSARIHAKEHSGRV